MCMHIAKHHKSTSLQNGAKRMTLQNSREYRLVCSFLNSMLAIGVRHAFFLLVEEHIVGA
jgi:hypothetical protein